jgi:hypothetical protein
MFQELGVPTLPGSRLAVYKRLCDDFATAGYNPKGIGIKKSARLIHASLEIDQLLLIATAARQRPNIWRNRLEPLISGAPFPTEALKESPSRDTQYENVLGAAAQLGGYDVEFIEPDVSISGNGLAAGIAAKRPRNLLNVIKNCRRAARQIRERCTPGIVAIDLSTALFFDVVINTTDPLGAKNYMASKQAAFVDKYAAELRLEVKNTPVIGVLLTAYAPALVYRDAKVPASLYTTQIWSVVQIAAAGPQIYNSFLDFADRAHKAAVLQYSGEEIQTVESSLMRF